LRINSSLLSFVTPWRLYSENEISVITFLVIKEGLLMKIIFLDLKILNEKKFSNIFKEKFSEKSRCIDERKHGDFYGQGDSRRVQVNFP